MLYIVKISDGVYAGPPSQAGARRSAYQWQDKALAEQHATQVGGTVVNWNTEGKDDPAIVTVPVTELRPGDEFWSGEVLSYTVIGAPVEQYHANPLATVRVPVRFFPDGGEDVRTFERGQKLTVRRPTAA